MFGIGLPEMILILALALIVVGPDKLPDLARSVAKGLMELKKTAEGLKESFKEEGNPLDEITPDLEEAAKSFKKNLLDVPLDTPDLPDQTMPTEGVNPPAEEAAAAYRELVQNSDNHGPAEATENSEKTEESDKAPFSPTDDQDAASDEIEKPETK